MKKLLLVVAIHAELKLIKGLLTDKKLVRETPHPLWEGHIGDYPVDVLLTSVGPELALAAARSQMNSEYGGALVVGFCGGMSLTLGVGDAVVASKVIGLTEDSAISMDVQLSEKLGKALISEGLQYRNVPLVTRNQVLESPLDKKQLFEATGAEAVDMESSEIVRAAVEKDVRAAVVKVVVDDIETQLPPFNEYIKSHGFLDHVGIKQVLSSHPQLSLRLRQFMKKGRQVLETAVPQIVPVVCEHWGIKKTT